MITKRSSRVRAMDESYIRQQEQEALRLAKKRRIIIKRLSFLAFVALILGSVSFVVIYSQFSTLEEKHLEKAALEEKFKSLKVEEKQLHQDIKNYNDLDYIAEIARRDYYLSKPGETLFKLPEPPSN
ncbi:septum formation initiator family protein [bacterium LRH843]|nr:septum formation initiator family protein [bacterium LRH843]